MLKPGSARESLWEGSVAVASTQPTNGMAGTNQAKRNEGSEPAAGGQLQVLGDHCAQELGTLVQVGRFGVGLGQSVRRGCSRGPLLQGHQDSLCPAWPRATENRLVDG